MVLGPVKLNTATDPRSGQTHKRRLHHMVIIDEMTLLDLVISHLDASPQLGQNHHEDIIVFEIYGLIVLIDLLVANRLYHGIRIEHTARTLIDTLFQKHWILLWLPYLIGRDGYNFSPGFNHIFNY